ncbi:hypothetical protein V8C86DRAFT_1569032 [Haematococcus lacustris]
MRSAGHACLLLVLALVQAASQDVIAESARNLEVGGAKTRSGNIRRLTGQVSSRRLRDDPPPRLIINDGEDWPPLPALLSALEDQMAIPNPCLKAGGRQLDIVIPHHSEDMTRVAQGVAQLLRNSSYLQGLHDPPCIWVITRGPFLRTRHQAVYHFREAGFDTRAFHLAFVILPDRGRQVMAMMFYLALQRQASSFPLSHTLFVQADLSNHPTSREQKRIRLLTKPTGLLALGNIGTAGCGHLERIHPGTYAVELIKGQPCSTLQQQQWTFPQGNAMAVSHARMMAIDLHVYAGLLAMLGGGNRHVLHDPVRRRAQRMVKGPHVDPANPLFSHVMERLWGLLWSCAPMQLLSNCRCYKDRPHTGRGMCLPNTCQCLDVPAAPPSPPPPSPPWLSPQPPPTQPLLQPLTLTSAPSQPALSGPSTPSPPAASITVPALRVEPIPHPAPAAQPQQ